MGCGASHDSPTEQVDESVEFSHASVILQDHHTVLVVVPAPNHRTRRDHTNESVDNTTFDDYRQHTSIPYSRKISQGSVTDGCYNLSSSENPQPEEVTPAHEPLCPTGVSSSIQQVPRRESIVIGGRDNNNNTSVSATTSSGDDEAKLLRNQPTESRVSSRTSESVASPIKVKPHPSLRERLKKSGGSDFQSIIAPDMLIAFPPASHSALTRAVSSDDEDYGGGGGGGMHQHQNMFFHAMDTIPPLRSSGVAGISTSLSGSHTATYPLPHMSGSPTPSRRESTSYGDYFSAHRGSSSSVAAPSSPLREGRTRTIQFIGETQCLLRSEISEASVGDMPEATHTSCPPGILAAETSFGEEIASTHVSSSPGSATSFEITARTAAVTVRT